MRTSFDPELELPKLHKWFAENQHPTRQQVRRLKSMLSLTYTYLLMTNFVPYRILNSFS